MNDQDDKLPMDGIEEGAPITPPENQQETQEQKDARERDERGRFKANEDEGRREGPRGQPNADMARRREAQERDEARREAAEAKKNYEALQKRLEDMSALARGEDPNAPKDPIDPLKPLSEKLDKIEQRFTSQDQERQAEETHRQVLNYAEQDEARFRATTPDFPDAIQHYIRSRLTEMQALGVDQGQAEQILAQEANQLLYQGAQSGKSPAEMIYTMAKARGYTPGVVNGNFTVEQPRQQPQNLGGRSLGSGGGAAGGGITAQQIAQMSEEDYMAFRNTPDGKRAIQRAMGGS